MAKVKKAGKAKVKKKWVELRAPKSFNSVDLGHTHVAASEGAIGKNITVNLMNLTGDMRKQNIQITFHVTNVQDGKGVTAVTGYELLPGSLKRIVRRGRTKVADSFITRTATGRRVRIKPLLVTMNPASASAASSIRQAVRERLKEYLKQVSYERLVQDLINFKVQRVAKEAAQKAHPIKTAEIRACFLIPEGTSDDRKVTGDYRDEDFVEVKSNEKESQQAAGDGKGSQDGKESQKTASEKPAGTVAPPEAAEEKPADEAAPEK